MYVGMLIYTCIYIYAHTCIKNPGVPLPDVHTMVLGFPLSWSVHLCHTGFTASAPHRVLGYPIFSLSSDSPSLAVPPGGCSTQKFVLS